MREIHLHLADVFFLRDGRRQPFVHLVHELGAVFNHLIHCALLQELPVLITVHAVILILTPVGIGTENLLCERHSAALAKFHFHMFTVCPYIYCCKYSVSYVPKYNTIWTMMWTIRDFFQI